MASPFYCRIQLAKNKLSEVIEVGEVDYEQFLAALASVDWEFESDRLQFLKGTWPSIWVSNCLTGATLWMSSYRPLPPDFVDEQEFRRHMAVWFVVRLDNAPDGPELIDLFSKKNLTEAYFETYEMEEIEILFDKFFNEDYIAVFGLLNSMNRFDDSAS